MTTLAQLHDCHGCNDERSIVQKKERMLKDRCVRKFLLAFSSKATSKVPGRF